MQPLYSSDEARGLWVWLEQHRGVLEDVGPELLGKGRQLAEQLGEPLVGVLLGCPEDVAAAVTRAATLPADRVVTATHPLLAQYTTDTYTAAFDQLARREKPSIVLLGATPDGRDLAGRLAVRLHTGLTADCTDLAIEAGGGLLESHVVGFGGGIAAVIKCPRFRPQMATVRPGVFAMPALDACQKHVPAIEVMSIALTPSDARVTVLERVVHEQTELGRAPVVVVGGAGTHGNFLLLEELAGLLGGEVGVSRVAVDRGWAPRERQIGQTGVAVHPKLAIACGVSGATQLTVGFDAAETVIAINTDGEAPIFEVSDYGVVDDLFRVLPPLLAELRQAR